MIQKVAVKAIIADARHRVLILRKSQNDVRHANKSGRYNLPGGKIEPGEALDKALIREVQEETGLTLKTVSPPFFAGEWYPETPEPLQVIGIFYSCQEWQGAVVLDDEHDQAVWINESEIKNYSFLPPEDKAIEAYFARQRRRHSTYIPGKGNY